VRNEGDGHEQNEIIYLKINLSKMKKEYILQGMSCGGCINNVKRALLQVPNVTEAEVHLNPQEAIITMDKDIDINVIQSHLKKAGHYTIKENVSNISI